MSVAYRNLPRVPNLIAGAESRGRQAREKIRAIRFEILIAEAASQRILSANLMIDLEFVVVDSLLVVALREEVIVALTRIENIDRRQREQIGQLLRDRTYEIVRDSGVGKCFAGKRITYRAIIRPGTAAVAITIVISKASEVAVT